MAMVFVTMETRTIGRSPVPVILDGKVKVFFLKTSLNHKQKKNDYLAFEIIAAFVTVFQIHVILVFKLIFVRCFT